jgi:hypothetical protein
VSARILGPEGELLAERPATERSDLEAVTDLAVDLAWWWCGDPITLVLERGAGDVRCYECRVVCDIRLVAAKGPDSRPNASEGPEAIRGAPGGETALATPQRPSNGGSP